jgi:EmrB/QacA subfamily drug resistance transporter
MAALDSSIVTIGLPTVLQDLQTTLVLGVWIITGYRLMLTILLVMLGRMADMYGRVRLYNIGFAVFTIGSLACGLSASGEQLVLFRFLQGIGAALLIANSAAIVTDAFPREQLGMGLGVNMMATNLGAVAGYALSGIMIGLFGWRSMFFINIPVGIFGTLWAHMRLKEVSIRRSGEKFDYVGSTLYCVGLSIVLYALTIGSFVSLNNLILLTVGIALFITFIVIERKQPFPTLDLSLFKLRLFAAGNLSSFLNTLAYNCAPYLISLFLQLVLAYGPTQAGLMMIPMNIIIFILAPISGRLSDKYGSRVLSSMGLALNAAALFWFSTVNQNATYSSLLITLVLFGFGRSLFSSPNVSSIMGCVPAEKRGIANGIRTTLTQTGSVLSIPVSMILMTFVIPYDRLSVLINSKELISSGELPVFIGALNFAFLVLGVICAIAIIPSMLRGPRAQSRDQATNRDTDKHT